MKTRVIGKDLEVSAVGLGCMGMSHAYGAPADKKEMTELLVKYGIKAIWNFAHIDLQVPPDVLVENVHLSESLMQLSYNITRYEKEHPRSEA